ncbi:MAG: alpha/beta hydrolase [Burkholderiales bacterium]
MTTPATSRPRYPVDIQDLEYLRHPDVSLVARIYQPRGEGPFPSVVFAHGGAWVDGDRTSSEAIHVPVAQGGVVIMSIEFRVPPLASYPASFADLNYAIRWFKHHARRFNTRADWVGTMGTSSGSHMAVLAAMRPFDARYTDLPFAENPSIDAMVPYVVALWPVICPLGRYLARKDQPAHQDRAAAIPNQVSYWITEEAMAEGSPMLALDRGEKLTLPKILYLQNPADTLHPRHLMERFVANYKQAGGDLQLELFHGENYDVIRRQPDHPQSIEIIGKIVDYINGQKSAA